MSKPKYLFFNSYKGGVGRTFAMINLALMFKYYSTKKVLIIDMDMTAPGVYPHFNLEIKKERRTLFNIIDEQKWDELSSIVTDTLGNPYSESRHQNLFLIPSSNIDLAFFNKKFDWAKNSGLHAIDSQLNFVRNSVSDFCSKENFDIVLFDFSAGLREDNIVNNVLANPDLIVIVSNLNQQGKEGISTYLQVINEKCSQKKINPPKILPIINKVVYEHPKYYENYNNFLDELKNCKENCKSLEILDVIDINFFENAIVGEFNCEHVIGNGINNKNFEQNLFNEYKLNSKLQYDIDKIFNRRIRGDGVFRFYETMYRIFEKTNQILYNGKKTTENIQIESLRNNKPIKLLIERTVYSEDIVKHIHENCSKNIEIYFEDSQLILDLLSKKKETKSIQKYDMISLPNFCLGYAVKDKQIISLEDLINSWKDKVKRNQDLRNIRELFGGCIINVDLEGKTYGIPFTRISSFIVFNKEKIRTESINYYNILSDESMTWGMVNNSEAYSHYYEFQNLLSSFNTDFFNQHHPSIYGRSNFENELFRNALKLYIMLYLKSKKQNRLYNSWNLILDSVNKDDIDGCFLWTEQLSGIKSKKMGYCEIPTIMDTKHNQGEGWFLGIVRKKGGFLYDENIFGLIKYLSSDAFQEFLYWEIGSSARKNVDERLISDSEDSVQNSTLSYSKRIFIQRILSVTKPKSNFNEMNSCMHLFSEIINKYLNNAHHESDVDNLIDSIIKELERGFKKILRKNYL